MDGSDAAKTVMLLLVAVPDAPAVTLPELELTSICGMLSVTAVTVIVASALSTSICQFVGTIVVISTVPAAVKTLISRAGLFDVLAFAEPSPLAGVKDISFESPGALAVPVAVPVAATTQICQVL